MSRRPTQAELALTDWVQNHPNATADELADFLEWLAMEERIGRSDNNE
jgi:hypothetical protein